jgi:hypothetical protein
MKVRHLSLIDVDGLLPLSTQAEPTVAPGRRCWKVLRFDSPIPSLDCSILGDTDVSILDLVIEFQMPH